MQRGHQLRVSKSRMRAPQAASQPTRKIVYVCLGLAIVIFAVYSPVFGNGFVNYDDTNYVTENPHVLSGLNWEDVKWAFSTQHTGYAHPVTWLTHQLDYQLYGAWPGGHHLTNVLLHILNAILFFLLFWRTTRQLWPSAFVAGIFAIHPLHVESVAWVAERKDVLSALFFVLTLHGYVSYVAKRKAWRYMVTLGWFVLGILSKPMLVTVPVVLLLFDYWPLGRVKFENGWPVSAGKLTNTKLVLEKVPFAFVAAGWSLLTLILQKQAGVVGQQDLTVRIANAIISYGSYLWATFWPEGLAVLYPYPPTVSWPKMIASLTLLFAISALALTRRKSSPHLLAGWLWYLGMLVPVIGLVQVGAQAHADRYTYLPQIGLWFALAWEILLITKAWSLRDRILPVGATAVVILLSACAWNQTKVWHDSESLWKHTISVTSDNFVAHYNLGHVIGKQGRYDEAVEEFKEVLRISPDFFDAFVNMGVTLAEQGRIDEAISYYNRALEIEPRSGKAHMQLALALVKQGKGDDALHEFRQAMEFEPNDPDVRTNLGLMLARQGKLTEAATQLDQALRLNPNSAEAHNNLGLVFLMAKQPSKGLHHFSEALRLKPDMAVAEENLKRAQRQIEAERN